MTRVNAHFSNQFVPAMIFAGGEVKILQRVVVHQAEWCMYYGLAIQRTRIAGNRRQRNTPANDRHSHTLFFSCVNHRIDERAYTTPFCTAARNTHLPERARRENFGSRYFDIFDYYRNFSMPRRGTKLKSA